MRRFREDPKTELRAVLCRAPPAISCPVHWRARPGAADVHVRLHGTAEGHPARAPGAGLLPALDQRSSSTSRSTMRMPSTGRRPTGPGSADCSTCCFPPGWPGARSSPPRRGFRADWAYRFMARHRVTHAFLAPTAIKRLAQTPDPRGDHDLALRVICTGGEALAADTLAWAEDRLGVVCNEFYGMTEVNHLIGNCAALLPAQAGGRWAVAYPGHDVARGWRRAGDRRGEAGRDRHAGHCAHALSGLSAAIPKRKPNCGLARGCAPTISPCRMATATSGTRAAPTTSSSPPAFASARPRSRKACSAIPPSPKPR